MRPVPKWWKAVEEVLPEHADPIRRRVAHVNAGAAVHIELANGPLPAVGEEELAEVPDGQVREEFLQELHHRQYGRPWAMGKYIFEFVLEAGLLPRHRLLDFGCGALRLGIWAIPYLDTGNYHGVDSHLASLEAATTYEIPFHGLEEKRPRLLWNNAFAFSHFRTTFDVVVDFSTSRTLDRALHPQMYSSLAEVVARGGRLLISPRLLMPIDAIEQAGFRLVRKNEQPCPLLDGHGFSAPNRWFEFARV